ncbi:MAG: tetratricopeptide repeat protein [Bradymonadales bacterium]|nr:tetratricopeptide repeat protein [Bradymonadales bacterium]
MALILAAGLFLPLEGRGQQLADRLRVMEQQLETYSQRLSHLDSTYLPISQTDRLYRLESRLADGRVLFLLGDYARAAVVLLDAVTNWSDRTSPGYGEARYYLAESLYQDHNPIAAQGYFREIADEPRDPFRPDAILRLLQIAFSMQRYQELDELDRMLDVSLLAGDRPDIRYARARNRYFRGDFAGAVREFQAIPSESDQFARATYFLGVCHVQLGQWEAALSAFEQARQGASASSHPDAPEIADLASLALGRVHFERGEYQQALNAYQAVSRTSNHFDRALYELAWVFIRLDRARDALRTLEILLLAVPSSQFVPQVRLLQGDLLIRATEYQQAREVFDTTVRQFGPLADQLATLVDERTDAQLYYTALIDPESGTWRLPDLARQWVADDQDMRRALELIETLEAEAAEIREARDIITELQAVLNSSSRVEVCSELESGYGQAIEIRFGLLTQSADLAEMGRELLTPAASPEQRADLERLRQRRMDLARQMAALPMTYDTMVARERSVEGSLQELEMELYRLGYALGTQRMQLTAMRQQLREDRESGLRSEEEAWQIGAMLDGLEASLEDLDRGREGLRRVVELERLQTGVGSITGSQEGGVMGQTQQALEREWQALFRLAETVHAPARPELEQMGAIRARIDELHRELSDFFHRIDRVVEERTAEIVRQISVQSALLEEYQQRLDRYQAEGERLSGLIAYENFIAVQQQFGQMVLQADVGIIDVAWREKEDRTQRINNLLGVRDSQIELLDTEFREVLQTE